mmetsp:Transcript_12147/g.44316  ORF Transcript_12147/g.44316 Transcript_12147/m.44316 type:complete len:958 (-) Transcript_12147:197-3070(-)
MGGHVKAWTDTSDFVQFIFGVCLPKPHMMDHHIGSLKTAFVGDESYAKFAEEYDSPLSQFRAYRLAPQFRRWKGSGVMAPTVSHQVHPDVPLCSFDVRGCCKDSLCDGQHQRDYVLSQSEAINYLFSQVTRSTGVEFPRIADDLKSRVPLEERGKNIVDRVQTSIAARPGASGAHVTWMRIPTTFETDVRRNPFDGGGRGDTLFPSYQLCKGCGQSRQSSRFQNSFLQQITVHGDVDKAARAEDTPAERFSDPGPSPVIRMKGREVNQLIESCSDADDCLSVLEAKLKDKDMVLASKGSMDEALALLGKALQLFPKSPPMWAMYLHLYGKRASRQAVAEAVTLAAKHNPMSPVFRILACDHEDSLTNKLRLLQESLTSVQESRESTSGRSSLALDYVLHAVHYLCSAGHSDTANKWLRGASLIRLGQGSTGQVVSLPMEFGWTLTVRDVQAFLSLLTVPDSLQLWLVALYMARSGSLPDEVVASLRFQQRCQLLPWHAVDHVKETLPLQSFVHAGELELKKTSEHQEDLERLHELWGANMFGLVSSMGNAASRTLVDGLSDWLTLQRSPWMLLLKGALRVPGDTVWDRFRSEDYAASLMAESYLSSDGVMLDKSCLQTHHAVRILAKLRWRSESKEVALATLSSAFGFSMGQTLSSAESTAEINRLRVYLFVELDRCEDNDQLTQWLLDLVLLEVLCSSESSISLLLGLIRRCGSNLRGEILQSCWADLFAISSIRLEEQLAGNAAQSAERKRLVQSVIRECHHTCMQRVYLYSVLDQALDSRRRALVSLYEDVHRKPQVDVGASLVELLSVVYQTEGASAAVESVLESDICCSHRALEYSLIVNGINGQATDPKRGLDRIPWLVSLLARFAESVRGTCEGWRALGVAAVLCADSGRLAAANEICSQILDIAPLSLAALVCVHGILRRHSQDEADRLLRTAEERGVRVDALTAARET